MAVNLDQMATQAQQQGNAMLANDQANAAQYKGNYNNYSNQANAAQQGVSDYTKAMQGAYDASKGTGNAQSAYDYNLGQQEGNVGYDKNAMTTASNNLNQAQGSLSAYNDFANTAASKWGLNAGGFAAANAGALGSINNNIASNQGVVSQLMDKYKTAQTGANSVVGLQQQGQRDTLAGLQNVYTNAANQRDQAASMMNFYDDLASKQGGLNAQQQQSYATAKAQIAAAQQAMAQSAYLLSQTRGQELANQRDQDHMNSQQYKDLLSGKVNANGQRLNSMGQPVVAPTAAQLQAQNAAVQQATQNTKNISDWSHGLGSMDLASWFKQGLGL